MRIFNSQALSLGLHAAAIGILLFIGSPPMGSPVQHWHGAVALIAPSPPRKTAATERTGGSNQSVLPTRHGAPPPRARRTFIPPMPEPRPNWPVAISVAFDSATIAIDVAAIGDPNSKLLAGGFGMRGRDGIGDVGNRGGIGPHGAGPPGISSSMRRGDIIPPRLIYQVEPEFSEEARKAKYQGTVVLAIEVDPAGRATDIEVVQGLGMGLDEKAMEAVAKWRFQPGMRDGRPVVTRATVQVSFRLL